MQTQTINNLKNKTRKKQAVTLKSMNQYGIVEQEQSPLILNCQNAYLTVRQLTTNKEDSRSMIKPQESQDCRIGGFVLRSGEQCIEFKIKDPNDKLCSEKFSSFNFVSNYQTSVNNEALNLKNQYLEMEKLQKLIRCLVKFTIQTYNLEYFKYSRKLGQGSQAKVYKVKSTNHLSIFLPQEQINKTFALKQVDKKQQGVQLECVRREINIMREISQDHNIVHLITVFESASTLYLLLEYKRGGNLKEFIKSKGCLSELEAKIITYQILKALTSIHKKQILHRDLTPVNILFDKKQNNLKKYNFKVSLADFGLSITLDDLQNEISRCGTPGYMAPESIQNCQFSSNSDIFSVGCLLFRMLTGENIFPGTNAMSILKTNMLCKDLNKIIENRLACFSQECRDVVSHFLNINADCRPNSEEALQNIWFLNSKIIILTILSIILSKTRQIKQSISKE
eukprot:403336047